MMHKKKAKIQNQMNLQEYEERVKEEEDIFQAALCRKKKESMN